MSWTHEQNVKYAAYEIRSIRREAQQGIVDYLDSLLQTERERLWELEAQEDEAYKAFRDQMDQ